MRSALVIVNNPTQLLFGIEAAHFFDVPFSQLRVVAVPTPGADDEHLYANLVARAGITSFIKLPDSSLSRVERVKDIVRFVAMLDPNDLLFTSMLNYLPARALIHRAGSRAVVTDDGAWTVYVADRRSAGHRDLRRMHALIPFARLPKSMRFFTLYSDLKFASGDVIAHNGLAWSREIHTPAQKGDHLIVLGSALVTDGFITEGDYLAQVQRLRAISSESAEYWPHRREDSEVVSRLCQALDMDLKKRLLPLETEILMANPAPSMIGMLPSTSATTLQLLQDAVGYEVVVALPDEKTVPPKLLELYRMAVRSSIKAADRVL